MADRIMSLIAEVLSANDEWPWSQFETRNVTPPLSSVFQALTISERYRVLREVRYAIEDRILRAEHLVFDELERQLKGASA